MADNLGVVRAAWDAYLAGDLDGVVARMAPTVQVELTNFAGWPEDPVYEGHAGFMRFISGWLAGWERYEAGVDSITEPVPGSVLSLSWQRGYGVGSHVPVEMQLAIIITLEDGEIVRFEIWSDREAASEEVLRR